MVNCRSFKRHFPPYPLLSTESSNRVNRCIYNMYGDIDEDSSEYPSCRTDTILYTSPSILWCNLLHLKSLFYKTTKWQKFLSLLIILLSIFNVEKSWRLVFCLVEGGRLPSKTKTLKKFKKFSWALFCLSSILISIDYAVFRQYLPQQTKFLNSN